MTLEKLARAIFALGGMSHPAGALSGGGQEGMGPAVVSQPAYAPARTDSFSTETASAPFTEVRGFGLLA